MKTDGFALAALALACSPLACLAQNAPPPPAHAAPAAPARAAAAPLPRLQTNGAATQLMVDGKPFVVLAGELHNSSASSAAYLAPIWNKLAALHLNTVIGTVSWELLEPQEGRFDFSLVDYQIRQARLHNLRLVLIWFATWKNAVASYVPIWVKRDLQRFPRVRKKDGVNAEELSPLGPASLAADSAAFAALMRHIHQVDPQHTVVLMQVENESGVLGDSRDRSPLAEAAWNQPVPSALLEYLERRKSVLLPELAEVWRANGFKSSGTWPEVFGSGPHADEIFMAWHVARYIGRVAEAGKAELDLPMYANAWLVQTASELPGGYPSGGPVSRVMDIWKAAAPQLDLLAPDIYLPDFQAVCASYTRSGNALFIPEAVASVPNLFWALGRHAALGYSPFGIDSLNADHPIGRAYQVLGSMIPQLAKAQADGRIAVVVQGEAPGSQVSLGGYQVDVTFARSSSGERGFALILNTAPGELLFVGSGIRAAFQTDSPGPPLARIGSIEEGRFENGAWIPGRRINGDENSGGTRLILPPPAIGVQKVLLYRHE